MTITGVQFKYLVQFALATVHPAPRADAPSASSDKCTGVQFKHQ